jgi:hypothetical protein
MPNDRAHARHARTRSADSTRPQRRARVLDDQQPDRGRMEATDSACRSVESVTRAWRSCSRSSRLAQPAASLPPRSPRRRHPHISNSSPDAQSGAARVCACVEERMRGWCPYDDLTSIVTGDCGGPLFVSNRGSNLASAEGRSHCPWPHSGSGAVYGANRHPVESTPKANREIHTRPRVCRGRCRDSSSSRIRPLVVVAADRIGSGDHATAVGGARAAL